MDEQKKLVGKYELLSLLASGGMAEIYLAKQSGLAGFERLVVVKKILPHLARDQRFIEMFFDEARIAAQLNHPNIVQIYDLGRSAGDYFIAMEYLEGESLAYLARSAVGKKMPLPPHISAAIILQVCDGLAYAHSFTDLQGRPLNIVHRDISPQNIIVLFSGVVKIVDFGIAKASSSLHHTMSGTIKGKFSYMSPEQVRDEPLDARSDIFALGTVFWELLTHRRLFKRSSEAATVSAIIGDDIPPVRHLAPDVPPPLSAIVAKALERNPAWRFQSAQDMAYAIRQYLQSSGAAAAAPDIADFAKKVFGDRARTKQRLFAEAQRGEIKSLAEELKPDTEESMPSRSAVEHSRKNNNVPVAMSESLTAQPTVFSPTVTATETYLAVEKRKTSGTKSNRKYLFSFSAVLFIAALWAIFLMRTGGEEKRASADNMSQDAGGPRELAEQENAGPRQPAKATLVVEGNQKGCQVSIDGRRLAETTPIPDVEIEPAVDHSLEISCGPDWTHRENIKLAAGEKRTISFIVQSGTKNIGRRTGARGKLKLDTEPWSEVYLGNRSLGMTPLSGISLPVGTYVLRAVNNEMGISKTFSVTIKEGQTTKLQMSLK